MTVTDVLIGSTAVIVETEQDEYKFDISNSNQVEVPPEGVPDEVVESLEETDLEIVNPFPMTITRYAHDEASGYERKKIASELGLDEDSDIVSSVADATYEIKLDIEVQEDGECYVTHYDGAELAEPKKLY